MPLWTITEARAGAPVIWLMFRQHSWESGTSWAGDGALRFLLGDSEEAAGLRKRFAWKIFPVADPDGIEIGGVRFNVNGYDLNRNWDAIDPKLMPEIASQHAAVKSWIDSGRRIDFFLTLHNTETGEYIEGPAEHRELVSRFRRNLSAVSSFQETRDEARDAPSSSTPGMKGRRTVNQGLFADFGIPAMLMETRVSRHPKLEGRFRTIEDWQAFGAGLVRAAAAAVAGEGL
jgi:murein tripeptide amidase MpaA